jgi:hypothetical protein
MRFMTALKAFFSVLGNRETADRVEKLLAGRSVPALGHEPEPEGKQPAAPKEPTREKITQSEAITLLSALQREARFLDFIQESLDGYSDEQVGAAARTVHDHCAEVLERWFAIRPLTDRKENETVEVKESETAFYRLVGDVSDRPPFRGTLTHHGWKATRTELPQWTGAAETVNILAPAEVEL